MSIDLHVHTSFSDGRLAPGELLDLAIKLGVKVIGITDHDSVDGIVPSLVAAKRYAQLTVIPGVEINTDVPRGEVHILGYFIDYTDTNLLVQLRELRDSRQGRALKMINRLRGMGMDIKWERVRELAQGGAIGRPHIAQVLLEAGYVKSLRGAFDKYIGHDGPAYVERKKLLPVEVVRLIISANGLPVLAHPADIDNLDASIACLKDAGLIGLEVYYKDYTPDVIERLLQLSRRYDLITTGGTDYHGFGDEQEVMLGGVPVPAEPVQQLFELADKRSVV